MYKIINQGARSFIVRAGDVIKGGTKGPKPDEKTIIGGPQVVEVNDTLGQFLSTYAGILVVEAPANAPKSKKGR